MAKRTDAADNVALNGITIRDEKTARIARAEIGETVAWARAFPRETPVTVPVERREAA